MCGLIALVLLLLGGVFGFTSVGSSATVVEPQIVEVQPILEMTPTPTAAEPQNVEAERQAKPRFRAGVACASVSKQRTSPYARVGRRRFPAIGLDGANRQWRCQEHRHLDCGWLRRGRLPGILHYDCGESRRRLTPTNSPEGFDVLLSNYSSHELTAACSLAASVCSSLSPPSMAPTIL